jgi:hypothetical protein
MNSTQILRTFNTQLSDFLEDIAHVFPENSDILTTQTIIQQTKKINPSLIINIWFTYVHIPYGEHINNNELSFFIDKDYKDDLKYISDNNTILESIDKIKQPIKSMDDKNKDTAMKYIKNLTKLSEIFISLK